MPRDPVFAEELFDVASDDDEVYVELFDYTPRLGDTPPKPAQSPHSSREKRKASRSHEYDPRTSPLDIRPGEEIDWSLDVEIAQRIPAAFKHRLKELASDRLVSRKSRRSAAAPPHTAVRRFLLDSGCEDMQVPAQYRHLVRELGEVPPISLNTAGQGTTVLREGGILRFQVRVIQHFLSAQRKQ